VYNKAQKGIIFLFFFLIKKIFFTFDRLLFTIIIIHYKVNMNNNTPDIGQRLERLTEIIAQLYATKCMITPYMDRFRELAIAEQLSNDAPETVVTVSILY
jgi:hypothetical protein